MVFLWKSQEILAFAENYRKRFLGDITCGLEMLFREEGMIMEPAFTMSDCLRFFPPPSRFLCLCSGIISLYIEQTPVGIRDAILALPGGLTKQVAIISMITFIAGAIGVINSTKCIDAAIGKVVARYKDNLYIMIPKTSHLLVQHRRKRPS